MRVNALRGSRTLTHSTIDLIAAAEASGAATATSNAGSPHTSGTTAVDAATVFDRYLHGDGGNREGNGNTSGSKAAGATATGRPTRIQPGLAATVTTFNSGGSATTAAAAAAARGTSATTTDNSQQEVGGAMRVDYGTAGPGEMLMRSGAGDPETAAAAAAAAEPNAAAAAAAAEAAVELARQRDPLWKYKQQVGGGRKAQLVNPLIISSIKIIDILIFSILYNCSIGVLSFATRFQCQSVQPTHYIYIVMGKLFLLRSSSCANNMGMLSFYQVSES